jgi:hypothetical protein
LRDAVPRERVFIDPHRHGLMHYELAGAKF